MHAAQHEAMHAFVHSRDSAVSTVQPMTEFTHTSSQILSRSWQFRIRNFPEISSHTPTSATAERRERVMRSFWPCALKSALVCWWCWCRGIFRSCTSQCESHWQRQCAGAMLHPAFLSAGSEWAEASFRSTPVSTGCCLPPETDAGAAAAPSSKRRRPGPGGISKVQ